MHAIMAAATRRRLAPGSATVAAVALAVHARTLGFGFTGLDDRDLVVGDQAFLAQPANLLRVFGRSYLHVVDAAHGYWRPLVTASYVLDAQWSGARPLAYHATNLLLHAVASVLVLALLRRFGLGRLLALAGALVFAVHPTLASAVAWIPGRNDTLMAVLGLASWLCLRRGSRPAHLVFFGLALMAKETAAALPLVWIVEAVARRRGRRAWPLAVAWAGIVLARFAVHAGTPHVTLREIAANAPLLAIAAGKVFLPLRPTALAAMEDLPVWPGLAAAALVALATWRVAHIRRGVVAIGAFAFAALLAPVLVVPGDLVLESRFYLPAVPALVVAGEIARAVSVERRLVIAFSGVLVAALALVTAAFEGVFHDDRAFAREAVAGSPRSSLAHVCLGQALQRAGDDAGALAEYRAALALGPAEVAHNDIAVIAMKNARWSEAENELRAEIVLNPGFATAYYNLAVVLRREERMTDACEAASTAIARAQGGDAAMTAELRRDCTP